MGDDKTTWWVRISVAFLILLVVGFGLFASKWLVMMRLTSRAVETRRALDTAFPSQDVFTPPLDGIVRSDRMERFLAVRRTLMGECGAFTSYRAAFQGMEELDRAEEEPAAGDFFSRMRAVASALRKMGPAVGEYAIARNEALLANSMGLGEYTWIYVLAYYSWMGNRPLNFPVDDGSRTKIFHGRVRAEVGAMMARHVADLRAAADTTRGNATSRLERAVTVWQAELDSLEGSADHLPFQDGLPRELEASFIPYRDSLDSLYCPATGELEVMRTVKTGLWYDHR